MHEFSVRKKSIVISTHKANGDRKCDVRGKWREQTSLKLPMGSVSLWLCQHQAPSFQEDSNEDGSQNMSELIGYYPCKGKTLCKSQTHVTKIAQLKKLKTSITDLRNKNIYCWLMFSRAIFVVYIMSGSFVETLCLFCPLRDTLNILELTSS
jgi:hypothetical protein